MNPIDDDLRTDAQLIAAIRNGESVAFDRVYARHRQWAYRLAYRFTGNDADAWDVLQEAFLYLAQKGSTLVLTASLRTLLFVAIRNLAMKANAKRRRLVAGDELIGALPAAQSPQTGAELVEVLQVLDLPHRQVILLRYVDDLTVPEIAQVLGIAQGTVKSRLFRAHQMIRDNPKVWRYLRA